ncbi:hypothetical protein FBEOM_8019 [Fusarium beomiforme]|uniref:Uncharacterized protein n=1 Tax=Fusarium beomiforme TaxID=44412 RepID=A0A9P5AG22_9HYPO|nr:hypothetical protein FBEOM_8019 [Fusarium beomiforme]
MASLTAPLKSLELPYHAIKDFKNLIHPRIQEPYRDLEEVIVDTDDDMELNKESRLETGLFDNPPASLSTICELTTLEQLGLRCDEPSEDWSPEDEDDVYDDRTYPQWPIDHDAKPQKTQATHCGHATCYNLKMPANEEELRITREAPELVPFVRVKRQSRIPFETTHLYRMLEHAKKYVCVLPKLQWMLFGQRPVKFVENAKRVVEPIPAGKHRDECKTYLGRVFGLASEIEIAHTKIEENIAFEVTSTFHLLSLMLMYDAKFPNFKVKIK